MKVLLGLVLLLAVAGGGYYLYSRSSTTPSTERQGNTQTEQESSDGSFQGTLGGLVKRGGNYKCDWSFKEERTDMEGTTYVSGNKFSGQAVTKTGDQELAVNMIGDGTTVYNWVTVAGFSSGSKFSYNQLDKDEELTEEDKKNAEQAFRQMNYKCSSWSPDPAKFVVPTNINFVTVAN